MCARQTAHGAANCRFAVAWATPRRLPASHGHVWFLATRKEDLTEAQVRQRAEEMFKQG
jgi:hypothetical protein